MNSNPLTVNAHGDVQDPGQRDSRLLAGPVNPGIVLLDAALRCCHASEAACELLGATDEAALRQDWNSLRSQLHLGDIAALDAAQLPVRQRVDVHTAGGIRQLRIEVHRIGGAEHARYVMLLRERERLGPADRVLLMASEAHADRHMLTGLVHDAKGPLNNLQLTLALLTTSIARIETPAVPHAAVERWRRYLDVLQQEVTRLSGCLDDIHALTQPESDERERLDMCAVLRDVARVLRHEATMREAALELQVPDDGAPVLGSAHQLRLAMLGFTTAVLDATQRAVVRLRVEATGNAGMIVVHIAGPSVALPATLAAELFRISGADEVHHPELIAGRMIVEAHGGDVTILHSAESGFIIRMPRAPAATDSIA